MNNCNGATPATLLIEGTPCCIRRIRPDDTTLLQAMHHGLSTRTIYQRFFAVMPELDAEQAKRFSRVDGVQRYALVVEHPDGTLVGVGRYDRLPPDSHQAEIAVVVADAFQHRGLGTALVTMLTAHARAAGVAELVADVLTTNRAMHRTFAHAGLTATSDADHGVTHVVMPVS
jgi:acetyltransferase